MEDPDQPKTLGSTTALDSSNIGFQLLKKHGWKEGTGLGASQQGRLEPVETYFKKNKKGVGAEKVRKRILHLSTTTTTPSEKEKPEKMSKKAKALSKRMRKMLDEEKRRQEMDLRQAFFREFWPDNV